MAPITIGSNLKMLNAQRRLDMTSSSLQRVYERLSSGRRVKATSDGPAGMKMSDWMSVDQRLASAAIRNTSDGISKLLITESALDQIGNVLSRLAKLSRRSVNGVYMTNQCSTVDTEFSALESEICGFAAATVVERFGPSTGEPLESSRSV